MVIKPEKLQDKNKAQNILNKGHQQRRYPVLFFWNQETDMVYSQKLQMVVWKN